MVSFLKNTVHYQTMQHVDIYCCFLSKESKKSTEAESSVKVWTLKIGFSDRKAEKSFQHPYFLLGFGSCTHYFIKWLVFCTVRATTSLTSGPSDQRPLSRWTLQPQPKLPPLGYRLRHTLLLPAPLFS
jgi:hypothetical protein